MKIASVYKVINRLGHNSNKQETLIPVEIQYTDQYASRVVPKQKIERKK